MRTYEKIDTVFNRDTTGTKQLILNSWRDPVVEYLRNNLWLFTEKVDGTNIRIHWDGHQVEFGGRTDRAQIPDFLLEQLRSMFGTAEAEELFEQTWGEKEVFLFGEGYALRFSLAEIIEPMFLLSCLMCWSEITTRSGSGSRKPQRCSALMWCRLY